MKKPVLPYKPSWVSNSPGYLRMRFKEVRKKINEDKRRAEEEAFQQQQQSIYSWK